MMVRIVILLVFCSILAACAGSNTAGMGKRSDVFQVVTAGTTAGMDEAFITISASIKTHKEYPLLFEPAKHGSDDYRLVVDINGQSLELPVQTTEEATDSDPQTDPESGTGLRYSYTATVRLRPGRYTVTARLPTGNVTAIQDVQITAGSKNITVKPIYRGSAGSKPASLRWVPAFRDGVSGLDIVAN
jgi:predicted small secreted protein